MIRELFISEKRVIENVIGSRASRLLGPVIKEQYIPNANSKSSCFNGDFALQFVPDDRMTNLKARAVTILPNTIGADLFVTVSRATDDLLHVELLSGDAFPIHFFSGYIAEVNAKLKAVEVKIKIEECAYARVFVIDNDVCFLAFPREAVPIAQGSLRMLYDAEDARIGLAESSDGSVVYVDGWMKTLVINRERKLMAVAMDSACAVSGGNADASKVITKASS